MKKLTILAFVMGMVAFTACSEKKAPQAVQPVEETVVTDSAFQQAAAGEYKSADGKRIITLGSDFTVKTTNLPNEYTKWALQVQPQGTETSIELVRKGLDADIIEQASLDTAEGKLIVKNETFRKAAAEK